MKLLEMVALAGVTWGAAMGFVPTATEADVGPAKTQAWSITALVADNTGQPIASYKYTGGGGVWSYFKSEAECQHVMATDDTFKSAMDALRAHAAAHLDPGTTVTASCDQVDEF